MPMLVRGEAGTSHQDQAWRVPRARRESESQGDARESRSLVLTFSTRAFDSPWVRAASMRTRWLMMDFLT